MKQDRLLGIVHTLANVERITNGTHPHAPWWSWDPEANRYEHIGVTTGLCAFILRYADSTTRLFEKASTLTSSMLEGFLTVENLGEMGLGGFCQLRDAIRDMGKDPTFMRIDAIRIPDTFENTLQKRILASIEYDTSQWVYHKVRPSRYIRTPESPFLEGLEEIVETELDYLVRTRPSGGVWGIDWSWFDNNERYPKAFAISENWWKAWGAIDNLLFLRSFDRI